MPVEDPLRSQIRCGPSLVNMDQVFRLSRKRDTKRSIRRAVC